MRIKKILRKTYNRLKNTVFANSKDFNKKVFTKIYQEDLFNTGANIKDGESKSGPGSDTIQTKEVIEQLPLLLKRHSLTTILDIPCGDYNWIRKVDLRGVRYIGADIVPEIVAHNSKHYASENVQFLELDIVNDKLPQVDVLLCRDLFVHLKYQQIKKAIDNIRSSGVKYLLTTSFKNRNVNKDLEEIGRWRPLNLTIQPFQLPIPVDEIFENCTEAGGRYNDKYLLLFKLN